MINFPTVGTNFVQMNFFFCVEKCLVFESSVCFSFRLLTFHKWHQTLVTGNKLHYVDLAITCSNHQRCKDDLLLCPDDTHGNWQVPVKPASCGKAASVTPYASMSGCFTLWSYMITNYF